MDLPPNADKNDETPVEEPARKKTCLRNKTEPDVTIVVGGVEFQEYGQSIRCWSEYFDTALESGMKESTTKRFEFPDRDPKQWEWIVGLMAPMSKEQITMETLDDALSWYDELCSPIGLDGCDHVLVGSLELLKKPKDGDEEEENERVASILATLDKSIQFRLKGSRALCLKLLKAAIEGHTATSMKKKHIRKLVSLVKEHEDCHKALLPGLCEPLPSSITEEQRNVLLENDLLHEMVYSELGRQNEKAEVLFTQLKNSGSILRIKELLGNHGSTWLRKRLRGDKVVGHLFPASWE